MSKDERVFLTYDEAIAMLPDGDRIHTFKQGAAGMLLGCDWDREDVCKAFESQKVELAGGQATAMDHGIALWDEDLQGCTFIETKKIKE